ncbi:unnamed protein product, partial [Penicillium pancosmium]
PGVTTNTTPTPLKAVQPCHTGHKGLEDGSEAIVSPRQQVLETDQAKRFSNKDIGFSSNLSPITPCHLSDSVRSVHSGATVRMFEQVPDLGTAALQSMQVLEPPVGRLNRIRSFLLLHVHSKDFSNPHLLIVGLNHRFTDVKLVIRAMHKNGC